MKIKRCTGTYRSFFGMLMLVLLCLSFSGQAFAEGSYQVTEMQMQGTITTDSALNVRRGPGKDYDVLTKVSSDTVLTITGQADNGWYQIEINGETGYVSDQYVNAEELGEQETEAGEPEEGYHGLNQSPYVKKLILIGAAIIVILVMIVLTIKGFRKEEEDDEYEEDEDSGDEDENDDEDDDYDGYEEDDGDENDEDDEPVRKQRAEKRPVQQGKKKPAQQTKKKEYVLREEDYRVQIDPSFFEDKEPIEQPAMVTGYLERKKIEEEALKAGLHLSEQEIEAYASAHGKAESDAGKQKELDEAMAKLSELQKEIERLKKQQR